MIVDFEEYIPHSVSELICVKCGRRWIGVYPTDTWLKELHCPDCGPGFVIMTGQQIETEENQ